MKKIKSLKTEKKVGSHIDLQDEDTVLTLKAI